MLEDPKTTTNVRCIPVEKVVSLDIHYTKLVVSGRYMVDTSYPTSDPWSSATSADIMDRIIVSVKVNPSIKVF